MQSVIMWLYKASYDVSLLISIYKYTAHDVPIKGYEN